MTDQEINIKIAELCGWSLTLNTKGRFPLADEGYTLRKDGNGITQVHIDGYNKKEAWNKIIHILPNYCNDLNAMHEAEKVLRWNGKRDLTVEYSRCIYHIIDRESGEQFSELVSDPTPISSLLLCATARQRAEAFLKVNNIKIN
jgi:hypothetical protein